MMNWYLQQTRWNKSSNATTSTWYYHRNNVRPISFALALTLPTVAVADWPILTADSDHALAAKIWDVRAQTFTQIDDILAQLPDRSWILLGENHQNPDHHQLESDLISYLEQTNRLGNVAFEMASRTQQDKLDIYLGATRTEITPEALSWNPGWPWDAYGQPVTTALNKAERVIGTDLEREAQMEAYRAEQYPLPENSAYQDFMFNLLFDAHCGHLPESQLGNMLQVQVARDRQMADAMLSNTDRGLNLMIAGSVHTRYDIGIPFIDPSLVSTTWIMIPAGDSTDPNSYLPESYSSDPVADFLVFTPERPYEDMCGNIPKREGK